MQQIQYGSLTMSTLYWCLGKVWTVLGNHQSLLLNCNQSKSGQSWRQPSRCGDAKSESRRGCVSWGSKHVRGEVMNAREPFLHAGLSPEGGLKRPDLNTGQHPVCEGLRDLHISNHDPPLYPFLSIHHHACLAAAQHFTHCGVREWEKTRRSLPSVGMKLRGPGSSGNARLDVRRTQHRRTKQEETTAAIAIQLWILLTNTKQ